MHRVRPLILLLIFIMAPPALGQGSVRRYAVDSSHSQVDAKVGFLGLTSKTARFPDMNGTLSLDIEDYHQVSMTVDVDARTLTTGDSQTKLLRGRQFFDVEHYPTVRFVAQKLDLSGDRGGTVTGLMTAKGVTRPVQLVIGFSQVPWKAGPGDPLSIVGTTTIDRRQFNMGAYPIVIGNMVKITIHARLVPAQP